MQTKIREKLLCLGALLVLPLAGCKEKPPEPPSAYDLGEDSVPPIDSLLTEETGGEIVLIQPLDQDGNIIEQVDEKDKKKEKKKKDKKDAEEESTPLSAEETDAEEAEAAEAQPAQFQYQYESLPEGGEIVKGYVELLTAEENGFVIIDAEGKAAEAPDYAAEEGGTAILAKDSVSEGQLFRVTIDWNVDGTSVTVSHAEGSMTAFEEPPMPMLMEEAEKFLDQYKPAQLGLTGETMQIYNVYATDGMVMADDRPCIKLRVYSENEDGVNIVAGAFLVADDQEHVYALDEATGTIEEMAL